MNLPEIQINISAGAIAWYGAIVSTGALSISAYTSWRDRGRLKIKYQKDMFRMVGNVKETYFVITAINKGRRPIALGNAGIRLFKGGALLLSDSVVGQKDRVLTEENPSLDFFVRQEGIDFSNTHFIEIYDRQGNLYKKYFHRLPTFAKIFYHLTSAKKKPHNNLTESDQNLRTSN